jgi:hypothetical protein
VPKNRDFTPFCRISQLKHSSSYRKYFSEFEYDYAKLITYFNSLLKINDIVEQIKKNTDKTLQILGQTYLFHTNPSHANKQKYFTI